MEQQVKLEFEDGIGVWLEYWSSRGWAEKLEGAEAWEEGDEEGLQQFNDIPFFIMPLHNLLCQHAPNNSVVHLSLNDAYFLFLVHMH